jgi:hypothetical protein
MSEMPPASSNVLLPIIVVAITLLLILVIIGICYFNYRHKQLITEWERSLNDISARLSKLEGQVGAQAFGRASVPKEQSGEMAHPTRPKHAEMGLIKEHAASTNRVTQLPPATSTFPVTPRPELRAEPTPSILEVAAKALESAENCNKIADAYEATGFGIDSDGRPSSEQTLSPDRGEVLVLRHSRRLFVVPSFNMKRNQGLYTSDAGRAAQSRLGWLFEIQRGERLLALEEAEITDKWEVIKKGRLALPLEKS